MDVRVRAFYHACPGVVPQALFLLRLDISAILESYQRSLIAKSLCRNVKEGREGTRVRALRASHMSSHGFIIRRTGLSFFAEGGPVHLGVMTVGH